MSSRCWKRDLVDRVGVFEMLGTCVLRFEVSDVCVSKVEEVVGTGIF